MDLTSWLVSWVQKEGGIYLSPWNYDRWLSPQRISKAEYVFSFWWKIKSSSSNQLKLNFWNWLHPKFAFLCCLLTQTATWWPNHTILTSSVKEILKALTNTFFLGPSLRVVRIFCLSWDVFTTRDSTLGLTGRTFSYLLFP